MYYDCYYIKVNYYQRKVYLRSVIFQIFSKEKKNDRSHILYISKFLLWSKILLKVLTITYTNNLSYRNILYCKHVVYPLTYILNNR